MGVTIHYRGSLTDLDRIEDFQDRVLDLALELGGQAKIWRSTDDDNLQRAVRGIIVTLCPGQESTSLLISPEGWLVGLFEIEAAEKGQLAEPPWCWVKTQFGGVEGHVALVELLAALKREFLPNLEVNDEGDYWETRDLAKLRQKIGFVQAAIDGLADGLKRYPLTPEAAEDPEILITRIERIAHVVHRTLSRPAEHPPVSWENEGDALENESRWDASFKENRRKQERLHRAIEEHLADGDDPDAAFDAAMHEETALGLPEDPSVDPTDGWAEDSELEDNESWRESLPEATCDADDGEGFGDRPWHPLQQRASDLLLRLHKLLAGSPADSNGSHTDVLFRGVGDITGGLAQALTAVTNDLPPMHGLSLVQLKRALRGAAFAQGALFPLQANGTLDKSVFDELYNTLQQLQTDIYAELRHVRERLEAD